MEEKQVSYIVTGTNEKDQETRFYQKLISHFLSSSIPVNFHLLSLKDNDYSSSPEIIAFKLFSIIYTKLRMNPWKMKDVPFGTKPLMVFSVNVKQ